MQTDTPDRILRINAVLERTGLSRATLCCKMQNSRFPKNARISTRCADRRESAISAWRRNPIYYSGDDTAVG